VARLRRARRDDIPALLGVVGGPEPARARALRRVLKTLAADVYVIDRDRRIDGVVAVFYRRSVRAGGLVAMIDALETFAGDDGEENGGRAGDLDALLEHAIERARKRGCVAVCAEAAEATLATALGRHSFHPAPPHRVRALAARENRGDAEAEEGAEG
jgi:hypothetical protein